jgi:hypothetical protein
MSDDKKKLRVAFNVAKAEPTLTPAQQAELLVTGNNGESNSNVVQAIVEKTEIPPIVAPTIVLPVQEKEVVVPANQEKEEVTATPKIGEEMGLELFSEFFKHDENIKNGKKVNLGVLESYRDILDEVSRSENSSIYMLLNNIVKNWIGENKKEIQASINKKRKSLNF